MSRFPGFTGGSNVTRSVNIDSERTINGFIELPGAGRPKVPGSIYKRPGVRPFVAVGSGPHRQSFQQDGLAWVVSGTSFAEIFQNQTAITRGIVAMDGNPATICSNGGADGSGGHQLLIVSGGARYLYDLQTLAFSEIVTPDTPGPWLMGLYINGSFLTLQSNGDKIYFSDLLDGTDSAWEGLNVLQVMQQPGNIAAIIASHNEMWPFSATQVNPWYGTSDSSVFTPVPGASIEYGIYAPWSLCRKDNALLWLSRNEDGGPVLRRSQGYSSSVVSPPAWNTIFQTIPNFTTAVGFTLQFQGHDFYGLYTPNYPTTPIYDLSNDTWVEWSEWNPDTNQDTPFIGRTHMYAFGKHLVGAIDSGWLYELSGDYWTDTLKV